MYIIYVHSLNKEKCKNGVNQVGISKTKPVTAIKLMGGQRSMRKDPEALLPDVRDDFTQVFDTNYYVIILFSVHVRS